MMVMTEVPDELFDIVAVPAVATHAGEVLARLNDVPAGPWLAVLIAEIDRCALTAWDFPPYLQACQRVQSWAAAQLAAGVAQFASLAGDHAVDKEIALALSEPAGAAQTRIWQARRLRRLLPKVWRALAAGEVSDRHVARLIDATSTVEDPALMAELEDRALAHAGGKTAAEWARYAKDALKRLDATGSQRRAKAARDQADVTLYPGEDGMADVVVHAPLRTR